MALSNQSDFSAFFRPRKVNFKIGLIPEDDLPRMAKFRKMTYLPRKAKSRKMTYREWPNPGRWLTEIGQIPAYDKPESQKRIWWNQQPKAILICACEILQNKCILGIENLKKVGNRARLVLFITQFHKSADENIFVPKKVIEIADRDFQGAFFYACSMNRANFIYKNLNNKKR